MNPKDFKWTEDQPVTVTNPTSEDFTWKVYGKDYMVQAGKTAKMAGFIAWLYVYNQAVKAAQADDKFAQWNDEGFRSEYYDRFVVGVDELVQVIEAEPQPEVTVFAEAEQGNTTNYVPEAPKRGRPVQAK